MRVRRTKSSGKSISRKFFFVKEEKKRRNPLRSFWRMEDMEILHEYGHQLTLLSSHPFRLCMFDQSFT